MRINFSRQEVLIMLLSIVTSLFASSLSYAEEKNGQKPIISLVSVKDFEWTSGKIYFTTSEITQAVVWYGLDWKYTMFTVPEKSFNYSSHAQLLNNLQAWRTYKYIIYVKNKGKISAYKKGTFTSTTKNQTISNVNDSSVDLSVDSSSPYWKNDQWWSYCGPTDKEVWTWDDLKNYWDKSVEGGCIIWSANLVQTNSPSPVEKTSTTTKSSWNSTEWNTDPTATASSPYWINDQWWSYCGPSNKEVWTWDNLKNYWEKNVEGGCVIWSAALTKIEKAEKVKNVTDVSSPKEKKWYTLKFSDEFNGNSLDSSKWTSKFLWGPDVTINNEEQYYVDILWSDAEKKNPFSFKNGSLVISAEKIPDSEKAKYNGKNYTSWLLTSYDAHYYTYWYTEARVKIPRWKGLWPAFWQLNHKYAEWLAEPEIDIMENLGDNTNKAYQTYHYRDTSQGGRPFKKQESYKTDHDYASDYHIFAAERWPGFIQFYIDDIPTNKIEGNDVVSNENMYILINLAVGGGWPWAPDSSTQFPAKYYVDWIRMYGE